MPRHSGWTAFAAGFVVSALLLALPLYLLERAERGAMAGATKQLSSDAQAMKAAKHSLDVCGSAVALDFKGYSAAQMQLAPLEQSETVLVSQTGPGPSAPLLDGMFRVAVPAGGRQVVVWRVPYHVTPQVRIANPDGAGASFVFYYVSHQGQVLGGPYRPNFGLLPAGGR